MKMRFTACSRYLMKTACQMAMIIFWLLLTHVKMFTPKYIYTKGEPWASFPEFSFGKRHFYPDSKREWENGLYTEKEKFDCAAWYILLKGMIAKPNSIQIYNKYMFLKLAKLRESTLFNSAAILKRNMKVVVTKVTKHLQHIPSSFTVGRWSTV